MSATTPSRQSPPEIVDRFRELTLLLYDTRIGLKTLEDRVHPFLAPGIEFKDPLIHGRGVASSSSRCAAFTALFTLTLTSPRFTPRKTKLATVGASW